MMFPSGSSDRGEFITSLVNTLVMSYEEKDVNWCVNRAIETANALERRGDAEWQSESTKCTMIPDTESRTFVSPEEMLFVGGKVEEPEEPRIYTRLKFVVDSCGAIREIESATDEED